MGGGGWSNYKPVIDLASLELPMSQKKLETSKNMYVFTQNILYQIEFNYFVDSILSQE